MAKIKEKMFASFAEMKDETNRAKEEVNPNASKEVSEEGDKHDIQGSKGEFNEKEATSIGGSGGGGNYEEGEAFKVEPIWEEQVKE